MAEERKYRIRVDGILVDVSKEVYRAYYSIERHTRTLDEKDIRNGKVLYLRLFYPLQNDWNNSLYISRCKSRVYNLWRWSNSD